jgi:hypothetical protein
MSLAMSLREEARLEESIKADSETISKSGAYESTVPRLLCNRQIVHHKTSQDLPFNAISILGFEGGPIDVGAVITLSIRVSVHVN